jgi:Rho GTPase-activating protein RGD1
LFQATRAWDESTAGSINFASHVYTMADELTELTKVIEKKRKTLKHDALRDETNVTNAESIAEKARSRHESLGTDLERAISATRGESYPQQKGRFGMARRSGTQVRFNVS